MQPQQCMLMYPRVHYSNFFLLFYPLRLYHVDFALQQLSILFKMSKSMKLLFFVVLLSVVRASDYLQQHTLQCSNVNDTWTYAQNLQYLWNIAILHEVDKYAFIVLCPLIITIQIIFVLTFVKYKLLENTPEDIIFALIITQMLLAACLMSDSIYNFVYSNENPMPQSFPKTCATIGSLTSIFSMAQKLYLIYFLVHVILNVNKSIKQNKFFKGKLKHLIPFLIAILFNFFAWLLGWLGLSLFGICQMTETRAGDQQIYFPTLQIISSFAFVIFAIVTYRYFKKHMPESSALNKRKYQENLFITQFTIGISIMQCLSAVAVLTIYLNCRSSNPNPLILIFATIFNLTRLAEFLYLIGVLMMYKKIGKKVKKYLRKCFVNTIKEDTSENHSKRYTHPELFELFDIGIKEKILDVLQDENQIDFLKVTQIMTILTGVRTAFREYLVPQQNPKPLKNLYYHQQVCFSIDSKWIKDYQQEALILPRLSLLDGKCTIYSPQIFKRLLAQDNIQRVDQSFDLIKNSSQLYKMCQTNNSGGGRSGQFFFFSCDNKYILKTVPQQQFTTLLQQLPLFYQHFTNHPNTLICKVYGMFRIIHKEIYRKYYILLMKNVSGCQQVQIKRIYDMKGSTDDRRVLKSYQNETQLPQTNGVVYKDLDFLSLQKRLYVKDDLANLIRNQLKIDTIFLKDLNIIDYSLLVMVVDWEQRSADQSFWGQLQRIQSSNCKFTFYHLALIDVSQKWDLQKKGEKWWKNIIGKKDTSAQQPSVYQQRFMNFIREITSLGTVELKSKAQLEQQLQNNKRVIKNAQQLNTPYKYLDFSIQMEAIRSQTEKMEIDIQIEKVDKSFSTPK